MCERESPIIECIDLPLPSICRRKLRSTNSGALSQLYCNSIITLLMMSEVHFRFILVTEVFFSVAHLPKLGLGRLVLRFLVHAQLDTLCANDQLVAEAATNTTDNRRTSMPDAQSLQSTGRRHNTSDRTATGIGPR